MLKSSMLLIAIFSFVSLFLHAAEKDAKGCKDHPFIPRVQGYYIAVCNEIPAGADLDVIKGNVTETVHFEGKSMVFSYMQQSKLKTKTSEENIRTHFDNVIKKLNGTLYGLTFGQKWPVYMFEKDGKKFWVILMVDSGKYFTGSYAYRIIEKK